MAACDASPLFALIERLPDGCLVLGPDGTLRAINPALDRLLAASGGTGRDAWIAELVRLAQTINGPGWHTVSPAAEIMAARRFELARPDLELADGLQLVLVRDARPVPDRAAHPPGETHEGVHGAVSLDVPAGTALISAGLERFLGLAPAGGATRIERWLNAIDPADRARAMDTLRQGPATPDHVFTIACSMRRGDGQWRLMEHQVRVIRRGRRGQPWTITGLVTDISESIPSRTADVDNPQGLELALKAGALSRFDYDFDAGQGWMQGWLGRQFGGDTAGRFSLADWRALIHPDDADRAYAALLGLQFGGRIDETWRSRSQDGAWNTHRCVAEGLSASGTRRAIGFVSAQDAGKASCTDIDGAAGRSVRAAELTTWTRDIASGVMTFQGLLVQQLGFEQTTLSILHRDWMERVHPDDRAILERAADTPGQGKANAEAEYRISDQNGQYVRVLARGGISDRSASGDPLTLTGIITALDDDTLLRRELAELRHDLEQAVACASLSAWTYDLSSRRLKLDGPVQSMIGLGPDNPELDILAWRARVHPDDLPLADAASRAITETGSADIEYRVRDQDGHYHWLNLRGGVSLRDLGGQPLRTSGFLTEVTERRQLEQALADRERQLADALEAGLVGIWTLDHVTGRQTARGEVLRWLGRDLSDNTLNAEDWRRLIHPDDLEAARTALHALGRGEAVATFDYRVKAPEGWRWVRTEGRSLASDHNGQPMRSAGVIIDISAERQFARELAFEKERLNTIYRQTPAMMHTIDAKGLTVTVNEYWSKRLGYSPEEAIGKPGWTFMVEEDAQRVREHIIPAAFATGSVTREPVRLRARSGEIVEARLSAFIEYDGNGQAVAAHGVFEDVTDLLEAQRVLQTYAEELERTNRELDRFATIASHDLQEPLRKISAFASLLRRRYHGAFDPEADRSLDFLVDAAARMRNLINDLLTYSRASSRPLQTGPVDLNALLLDVRTELDLTISQTGASFIVGRLPTVEGDATLLKALFQNLLSNALKYRRTRPPEIDVSARCDKGVWTVCVSDNGIGIKEKFYEKIFAPFQRLHGGEAHAGTGIGLAICQQAVERHGGRIWVRSVEGEGSKFFFTLPERQSEAAA